MSTLLNSLIMESWVQLTILYHLNCAQNSSARACVPSNIAGGMPCIPPFGDVGAVALVLPVPPPPVPVALADMWVVC